MNKRFSRILLIFALSVFMLALCTITAAATGGRDGNIDWEIDGTTLIISPVPGTDGAMHDHGFWSSDFVPWWDYHETITDVVIKNGVSRIGDNSFRKFFGITHLYIPGSVKSIGYCAVNYCYNLESVTLDEGVETVEDYAFEDCYALSYIWLPQTLKSLGKCAFEDCPLTTLAAGTVELKNDDFWFDYENTAIYATFYGHDKNWGWTLGLEPYIYADDFGHYRSDKKFHEVHYDYSQHMPSSMVHYTWNGNICTATTPCSTCAKWYSIETQEGVYVKDTDTPCLGEVGHYEATFTHGACLEKHQKSAKSSVVIRPGNGHVLGDWEVSIEPKCEETGERIQKCTVCGEIVNRETIPATGHDFLNGKVEMINKATCTSNGTEAKFCANCYKIEEVVIEALGHVPGDWERDSNGELIQRCKECGMVLDVQTSSPNTGSIFSGGSLWIVIGIAVVAAGVAFFVIKKKKAA